MQQNLLQTPIEYLKGVGPNRGELLRKELGIFKYGDLVNFFPNRYIDRTRYFKVNELQNTVSEVQIIGKIIHIPFHSKKALSCIYFGCYTFIVGIILGWKKVFVIIADANFKIDQCFFARIVFA